MENRKKKGRKNLKENNTIQYFKIQKEDLLEEMRKKGFRITNQRKLIIDTILENECSCCKEIYYQVHQKDDSIGIATVYRMIKALEEIRAIDRKNLYKISCCGGGNCFENWKVILENNEILQLSSEEWEQVLKSGLKERGYIKSNQNEIVEVNFNSCRNPEEICKAK